MDRSSREFQAFLKVHEGVPRQGPGSTETTFQALALLPPIRPGARIYDFGCGPGRASIALAIKLQQKVVAVDLEQDFLHQLQKNAAKQGVADLIETRCADMTAVDDPPETIDLIWAEGSIYCVGFDNALSVWRPLLAQKGLVACTELSWLTAHPSNDASEFWRVAYPSMRSVPQNIAAAKSLGYDCLDHFTLPVSCWWDEYYEPLLLNMERLKAAAADDQALSGAIANTTAEIDLFRRRHGEYGYEFYLLESI